MLNIIKKYILLLFQYDIEINDPAGQLIIDCFIDHSIDQVR